jgi:3-oxoacyl-[acyl-carrier-protein] synthase-3
MGTRLDRPAVAVPARMGPVGRVGRASARKLAERAAAGAMANGHLQPSEVDLLLNVGLYHDRNLGEPAMAALIQDDMDINAEDPYPGGRGSFSFDVANGACGVLTALQIADGFVRSGVIDHALVVASDADPGRRMGYRFPFSAAGAAVVCGRAEAGDARLSGFRWEHAPGEGELFRARVGFFDGRNRLRIEEHPDFAATAAVWAAKAAASLLADARLRSSQIDLVVANPLTEPFLAGLSAHLGVGPERVVAVDGAERVHTAGLLVALEAAADQGLLAGARRVLLVSAGAGIVAGAALLLP